MDDGEGVTPRKIIHVDMDAFYASVEQRDNPELRGRPVAVGGTRERGVVAAASYEARRFGVRSAMASASARRRCPELIFVKPRFEVYRAVSQQIRAIFADYADLVEPLSLDEAYLDVSDDRRAIGSATRIAEEIRARIRNETGLTASAGVSYNKLLAKLASDHNKPDGLCVVPPARGAAFIAALDVARIHGVGPVTAAKMYRLGIRTGGDLRAWPLDALARRFGRSADYYHLAAQGIDHRQVRADRIRKSVGSENTFFADLLDRDALLAELEPALDAIGKWIDRTQAGGRTLTLKAKFGDFRQVTRSRTVAAPFTSRAAMAAVARELLDTLFPLPLGIRLLGLTLSNLDQDDAASPPAQLGLGLD